MNREDDDMKLPPGEIARLRSENAALREALEAISELCDGDEDTYETMIRVQKKADSALAAARRALKGGGEVKRAIRAALPMLMNAGLCFMLPKVLTGHDFGLGLCCGASLMMAFIDAKEATEPA